MPNTSDCLLSTVKNVSGGELVCSMWPPHGKTFDADEEASVYGDIIAAFQHGGRPERNVAAFVNLLTGGQLELIRTPSPIMYDAVQDRVSMLIVNNGAIFAKDPCWADTIFSSPL